MNGLHDNFSLRECFLRSKFTIFILNPDMEIAIRLFSDADIT